MKNRTSYWLLAGIALTLAGCSHQQTEAQKNYAHGEEYLPDGTYRDEVKFVEITVANGARADGTLRTVHFNGNSLNSLGERKLDYMLQADTGSSTTMTVFIDLSKKDTGFEERRDAVSAYLKSKGLKESQIAVVDGPNLRYSAPAAAGSKALDAFSTSDGVFSNAASSSGSGGSSSGSH